MLKLQIQQKYHFMASLYVKLTQIKDIVPLNLNNGIQHFKMCNSIIKKIYLLISYLEYLSIVTIANIALKFYVILQQMASILNISKLLNR